MPKRRDSQGSDASHEPLLAGDDTSGRDAPLQESQPAASDPVPNRANQGQPHPAQRTRRRLTAEERQALEDRERQKELKYGAESVISLVLPVSVCMMVVIFTVRSVSFYTTHDTQLVYTPMHESDTQTTGERVGGALINVTIVISIVVAMTMLLVMLYKYRCYTAIHGWLLVVSMMLLFFMSWLYIDQVVTTNNMPIDVISLYLFIWNFGVGGLFCIHWKGPLRLQQAYHVFVSSLMALILIKNLPDWTGWMLLAGIAIYDLLAVLCPGGPLAQLLETAQERGEPLFPALIYSSAMAWIVPPMAIGVGMANRTGGGGGGGDEGDRDVERFDQNAGSPESSRIGMNATPTEGRDVDTSAPREMIDEEEEDGGGVKLGLGDFIFYSVLVGKAATTDWGTIFACYIAIIVGLVCTLFILSVYQKALPALPISVAFGIVFYFSTNMLIMPCLEEMGQFGVHM